MAAAQSRRNLAISGDISLHPDKERWKYVVHAEGGGKTPVSAWACVCPALSLALGLHALTLCMCMCAGVHLVLGRGGRSRRWQDYKEVSSM